MTQSRPCRHFKHLFYGKAWEILSPMDQGGGWCVNCEFRDMVSQVTVTEEELVVGYLNTPRLY